MGTPSAAVYSEDPFGRVFVLCAAASAAQRRSQELLYATQGLRWRLAQHVTRPAIRRWLRFVPIGGASNTYLKIDTEERDGAFVIRLSEELDLDTVTLLQAALDGWAHNSRSVILDCQHLTYMDSTGFKLLADVHQRGRRTILAALTPTILRVLRILALDTIIPVAPSVEEALKGLDHLAR